EQNRSFYWDDANQILYIHIDINTLPVVSSFSSGYTFGYTDSNVIYIDNVLYEPLLKSIPSIAQQADLAEYKQMAFINGELVLDNTGGHFDAILEDSIYGNDAFIYELDAQPNIIDYPRSALKQLASLYVEDYQHSIEEFSITVQDQRKAHNANLLQEFFEDGNPVPLMYGPIRSVSAKVIDDTQIPVMFRVATELTALGTIECEGDFGWQAVTPISYDLANGTFLLSATYARSPGNSLGEDTGSVLPCRVRNCVGIPNNSVLDVIKHINSSVLDIEYNASNYNLSAWASASALLCPVGVVFNQQQEVYKAIATLQNGANLGFRYEITPDGLRSVRIDDWARPVDYTVFWDDIKDNLTLKAVTDSTLIAAVVAVDYLHDYAEDAWTRYVNDRLYDEVLLKYRQAPTLTIEALMLTEAFAEQRSEFALERYSSIPRKIQIQLHGRDYYGVQIYDMLAIELSIPGRPYLGWWEAQVISIDPDFDELSNAIEAVLVRRIPN
ncbi:MAG: hypothetical protein PHU58_07635, partial [Prevotella sp.]|nr:hypothetical protein [Prevotella sp.]